MTDFTNMLIDIRESVPATKQRVEDIQDKINRVDFTDERTEESLEKSIESSHRIDRLTSIQNWLIGILISGIGVTNSDLHHREIHLSTSTTQNIMLR